MAQAHGLTPMHPADHLAQRGYAVVPQILSLDEVQQVRTYLSAALFEMPAPTKVTADDTCVCYNLYAAHPALRWLLVHEATNAVLRSVLPPGPLLNVRAASAHRNRWSPWHRDTDGQDADGFGFHRDADFLMVQVAHYLQPGSLDVCPGSHRGDPHAERPISLDTKPGDLLLFDTRIIHRGSLIPLGAPKLVVFNLFSAQRRHAEQYHRYIDTLRDSTYRYLNTDPLYPPELVVQAASAGIELL